MRPTPRYAEWVTRTLRRELERPAVEAWIQQIIDLEVLSASAWALRHAVRVSDAFYLAAAAGLRLPLLTSDTRLARSPVQDVTILLLA